MKYKKAQVNIMEMSFMIVAIILFFVIVGLFVLTISLNSIKSSAQQSSKENAMFLVSQLAGSPELTCGKSQCVDTDKLLALTMSDKYKRYWAEIGGIEILRVYPNETQVKLCSQESYPNCNKYVIKPGSNNSIADSSFVSLCREDYKNGKRYSKCELGKIIVYTSI